MKDSKFNEAQEFMSENSIGVDRAAMYALEFTEKFKSGNGYLEMVDRAQRVDAGGQIPTERGEQGVEVCFGLLCYSGVQEMDQELAYLVSDEQRMLLIDRICQGSPKPTKLELLVKSMTLLSK